MDYDMNLKQLQVITGRMNCTWESHQMNQNKLGTTSYTHGIRFYPKEANWLNISQSIRLTDDSFAVVLQVHHNLHCLASAHLLPDWTR
ncbi:hypothetical protein CJF30_00006599 [Rutstroemia sp. NJR-2017a BBW]|nr:hypothetical protein CJF30_00006599 [Rutstroemia sp. NJR-2017a BBW]